MLLAAAVTTANSQKQPTESLIYRIDNDGTLKGYRRDGAATVASAWGANNVGNGWNDYQSVFPAARTSSTGSRPTARSNGASTRE